MDRWEQIDREIDRAEGILLVLLLSLMIGTAFLQIVLRNLFATGLAWGDPLVRNLVVWVGFIGAALATREGKHITIDLLLRGMPQRTRGVIERLTHLFSSVICGLLTFAAIKFIRNEALMGSRSVASLSAQAMPSGILPPCVSTAGLRTTRMIGCMSLHVLRYLHLHEDVVSFTSRWNQFADELSVPKFKSRGVLLREVELVRTR